MYFLNLEVHADYIQQFEHGMINWTNGEIFASSIEAPDDKYQGQTISRTIAEQKSQSQAYHNLMSIVKEVQINDILKVRDVIVSDAQIKEHIENIVNSSTVTKKEYLSDGTISVILQLNMTGGFNQLFLPEEIKHIKTIKQITNPQEKKPSENPKKYSGLVIDARGIKLIPSMMPKIISENGEEVYGPEHVSREYVVQNGMCCFLDNFEDAIKHSRVADNPLIIRGIRTFDPALNHILISNAEASKLKSFSECIDFLKKGKVIIVINSKMN